jgi:hypothetical protein
VLRLRSAPRAPPAEPPKVESGLPTHGYNVHAGVRVPAGDRARLERLCRYAARGPIANERLSLAPDGRVVVRLRRRWRDGTTHLVLSGPELIEKLCALTPPPRFNLVRFHGVLAPASKLRPRIVPNPPKDADGKQLDLLRANSRRRRRDGQPARAPRPRTQWATLLRRTFGSDALMCQRCGGRLALVTTALSVTALRVMLERLDPSESHAPAMTRARAPPPPQMRLFRPPVLAPATRPQPSA